MSVTALGLFGVYLLLGFVARTLAAVVPHR